MMTKHKHCDLIKAWADGESIQYWSPVYKKWIDFEDGQPILWNLEKYRIKPKLWFQSKGISDQEQIDIEKAKILVRWVHEFCDKPVLKVKSSHDNFYNDYKVLIEYEVSMKEAELFEKMFDNEDIAI